jgi:multiple sugar transport system substrate-binding protein
LNTLADHRSIRRSIVGRFPVRYWSRRITPRISPLVVIASALALILTILAGCGGAGSTTTSGPVNLTFWGFNQQITEQADLFNASHPNIHVTGIKQASGPNEYYPKVLTAVKAGNGPDVALVEYQYIPTLASNQALVDLSQYGASDVKSQFADTAWQQVTQGSAVYGYPQDTGPMGLFYNTDTFTKAGITTPPATWADFKADAVKIHALGPDYYIVSFPPQSTGWNQALMWQAGASWFTVQGNAWKVTINSAASKQVAQYWQDLIDQHLVATVADFGPDWNAGLDAGKIASWPSAVWGQGVITGSAAHQTGKFSVAPMPQWTAGGTVTAMWGGSAISVIGGSKHPKEAEEFVRWYLTDPGSLKIGVKEIGWYPSNTSARSYPEVTTPSAFYSNQVVDSVFNNTTLPTVPWTWPPTLTAVNQFMGDDFNAAVTNHTPLTAALDKLQGEVVGDMQSQHINVAP